MLKGAHQQTENVKLQVKELNMLLKVYEQKLEAVLEAYKLMFLVPNIISKDTPMIISFFENTGKSRV